MKKNGFATFTSISYGVGASIVLVGAMFKLNNWAGASTMLTTGLGIEAFLFLLSIFEPKAKEYDWSIVYPELNLNLENQEENSLETKNNYSSKKSNEDSLLVEKINDVFEKSNFDVVLIQNLSLGIKNLNDYTNKIANIADISISSKEYVSNLSEANKVLESMVSSQRKISESYGSFIYSLDSMKVIAEDSLLIKKEMVDLKKKIESLNSVYTNMLGSFKI
jgi:gliding motility-associated protein GldL